MLLPSLNECHLVDLFEGRRAFANFGQRGISQKRHPFLTRNPLDLRCRPAANDHLTDVVGQSEEFRNGAAATEAGARALQTSDSFYKQDLAPHIRIMTRSVQTIRGISSRFLATRA